MKPVLMFVLGAVLASGIAVLLVSRKSTPEPAVTTAVIPAPATPAADAVAPPPAEKPSALQAPEEPASRTHTSDSHLSSDQGARTKDAERYTVR